MQNTGKLIALIAGSLIAASAALVAIVIGLGRTSVDPSLRAADLRAATDADVPAVYASAENPYAADDADAIATGQRLATRHCRSCHGHDLRGSVMHGGAADLVAAGQTRSDAFLFWAITDGSRMGMPNWGAKLSEDERWQLITYLRSLDTK